MSASVLDFSGSGAQTLRLSITGESNLECFYYKALGFHRDITRPKQPIQPSDVTKLVRILGEMGVRRVSIAGGEPLLRKDAANFVKSAYAHKCIEEVRLTTNGTYLKNYADVLRKLGLKKIDINCDSINYAKYHSITKRDDLFRVLDGLEKVEKLNFPDIRLNVILMRGINDTELIDIASISKQQKVHVRFMEYTPLSQDGEDPYYDRVRFSVLDAKRVIHNFQKLTPLQDLDGDQPELIFQFIEGLGKISFLSENEIRAERRKPTVLFTADGCLVNELYPNRIYPILEDLRRDAKELKLHKLIEKVVFMGSESKAESLDRERSKPAMKRMVAAKSRKLAGRVAFKQKRASAGAR